MKIYHGSKKIIEYPYPKGSKISNDYGPAFYLTKDFDSAAQWACRNNAIGYVNEYKFDMKGLKVLDLTDKSKYSVLNWIAILMHFRYLEDGFKKAFGLRLTFLENNYYIDVNDYDLVVGFRADDAYFRFPLDFIRGNLTVEQVEEAFNLGELGVQYVLISEKAFEKLRFENAVICDDKYVGQYFENVDYATKLFDNFSKDEDGTRIQDLVKKK